MLPPMYDTQGNLLSLYWTDGTPASGTIPDLPDPPEPPPLYEWPRRMQVATYGRASQTGMTPPYSSTSTHTVQVAHTGLSVGYCNEAAEQGSGPLSYAAEASINGGATIPLSWDGEPSVVLPIGGYVECDPMDVALQPGDSLEVTTTVTSAGGNAEVYTMDGVHWPIRITGLVTDPHPAVMVLGSSTAAGTGDGEAGGIVPRGLDSAGTPWTNISWGGGRSNRPPWNTLEGLERVRVLADHDHTHVLVQLGDNHATFGAARFRDDQLALWRKLADHGYTVAQMTLKPQADSTDGWTTLEGQTPRFPGVITAINAWLRDGAPVRNGTPVDPGSDRASRAGELGHPLATVIDGAVPIEHGTTEKFRVDAGPLSYDGIHMTPLGHELMAAPIHDWASALTA